MKTLVEANCFVVSSGMGCSKIEYEVSLDGEFSRCCCKMPGIDEMQLFDEERYAASLR